MHAAGLTADQVRALAPDDGVARSGEALANARHWSALGRSERAAWGSCQGSGSSPYQVVADLAAIATKCSCPSRKFPCKHGLGLLLLVARDVAAIPAGDPPPFAEQWLTARDARAQAAATRAEHGPGPVDEAARVKRIAAREQKVAAGVAELDRWLRDVIRRGLATAKGEGYAFWDAEGARLVDAQAAGLARSVRALGEVVNSGEGWPDRTLERLGRLHLLASAYSRQDALPEPLRADVRMLVGWTTKEDDLPGDAVVQDRWLVIGRTVEGGDERLTTARTWLIGETSRRVALHLAFGVAGSVPEVLAVTGSGIRCGLAFFPSATPLRAVPRGAVEHAGTVERLPAGASIAGAAHAFGRLVAVNPFIDSWPMVLDEVTPIFEGGRLRLIDAQGDVVTAGSGEMALRLFAAAGGHPVGVAGEWLGDRFAPLSALIEGRLIDLTLEQPLSRSDGGPLPTRDRWRDLVTTALLGTGRGRALERGVVLPAAEAQDPERAVLATAGARAVSRRAGWAPPKGASPMAPADADPRPVAPAAARGILRRLIRAGHAGLTGEWLDLATRHGFGVPHEELPDLLRMAADSPLVRGAMSDGSQRIRWLGQHVAGLHLGLVGAEMATRSTWDEARTADEHAQALAAIRRRDPDEGRSILEADWNALDPDTRPRALAALAEGLSTADEAFLERALRDRRSETRATASHLLARLTDSALAGRMSERARPLIALGGRIRPSLDIALPEWDDGLERDGIVRKAPPSLGERAWWRHQILARVPPARWESWLGVVPSELIRRAGRSEDGASVLLAWAEATVATRDPRWARALLEGADLTATASSESIAGLIGLLPGDDAEKLVATHLFVPATIALVPGPWSAAFGGRVLELIARDREPYPAPETRALSRIAAQRLPATAAGDLEIAVRGDRPPHVVTNAFEDAIEYIRLREQMARAFETAA